MKPLSPEIERRLKWFKWQHLPPHLQEVSRLVAELADAMAVRCNGDQDQLEEGLQKLIEAKDCFVRAAIPT